MQETEVREVLNKHVTASRQLLRLRKGVVLDKQAEGALHDLWQRHHVLARIVLRTDVHEEYREMALSLMALSHQLIRLKKQEFALATSLPGFDDANGDDIEGGAGVCAVLSPTPPPRFGRDAKPFPEDEE